jgi:hypothetical protein
MISADIALQNARRLCEANCSKEWLRWDEATAEVTLREDLPVVCWEVMIGDPLRQNWFEYEIDDFPMRLYFDAATGAFYGYQSMRTIVTADLIGKEIIIPK